MRALPCMQRCRPSQPDNWWSLSWVLDLGLSALHLRHSNCSPEMPYKFWEQLSSACGFHFQRIYELIPVKTWLDNFRSLCTYSKDIKQIIWMFLNTNTNAKHTDTGRYSEDLTLNFTIIPFPFIFFVLPLIYFRRYTDRKSSMNFLSFFYGLYKKTKTKTE